MINIKKKIKNKWLFGSIKGGEILEWLCKSYIRKKLDDNDDGDNDDK
jgi:hypothetical protein